MTVPTVPVPTTRYYKLIGLARTIVDLGSSHGPGALRRRSVTLSDIIGWAKTALEGEDPEMKDGESIKGTWPDPPETTSDKVFHVLDAYRDFPDDMKVIKATEGMYGPDSWTGLTLGDLRSIAEEFLE